MGVSIGVGYKGTVKVFLIIPPEDNITYSECILYSAYPTTCDFVVLWLVHEPQGVHRDAHLTENSKDLRFVLLVISYACYYVR